MRSNARDTDDIRIFSREALREVDRLARSEYAIPSLLLMENAARHVADVALDGLEDDPDPGVLVVCGTGNNAGDALSAARHLHNAGLRVRVLLVMGENLSSDASVHLEIVRRMRVDIDTGVTVEKAWNALGSPGLVIDGLFGTGLTREVQGAALDAVNGINSLAKNGVPVLAVDTPSGLDVDSGCPLGAAVRASVTVSFVGLKQGFLTLEAQEYVGDVIVCDIGAPRELVRRLGRPLPKVLGSEPRAGSERKEAAVVRRPGRWPSQGE
jgi:hydroxyethylthiazole kinase-like uncharacterized protein yjeF